MAGLIAFWGCQCGTAWRVIAEVYGNSPAIQTVSCPRCRTPQAIHADRVITITEDTSDLSPALARCEEKERLLGARNKALDVYRRMTAELAKAAGMMAHAEFQFLYDKVVGARQYLSEASQQVIEHTAKHGC